MASFNVHTCSLWDEQDVEHVFDVSKLIEITRGRPILQIRAVDLPMIDKSVRSGFDEVRRLPNADTQYPILMDEDLRVIVDGKHRASKLLAQEAPYLNYRVVTWEDLKAAQLA